LYDGGNALHSFRRRGALRGIHEVGQQRAAAAPVIRAIGRQDIPFRQLQNPSTHQPIRMGAKGSKTQIPTFLTKRVLDYGPNIAISNLTKTSLGAPSKRKGKTRKNPRNQGGRRKKRRKRKTKRKRKRKRKTKRKKSRNNRKR
jgi:hypothetical protein